MRSVAREGDRTVVEAAFKTGAVASVLTQLESVAAIHKRFHDGVTSETNRNACLATLANDILPRLNLLPLDASVLAEAEVVVALYPLRTLDAIHVATAQIADRHLRRSGNSLAFCTADRRQMAAAATVFGVANVIFVPRWR